MIYFIWDNTNYLLSLFINIYNKFYNQKFVIILLIAHY